jgi:hypothetical protein
MAYSQLYSLGIEGIQPALALVAAAVESYLYVKHCFKVFVFFSPASVSLTSVHMAT